MLGMAQPRVPPERPVEPVRLGRPPTYADIEALAEHLRGEIVDGQLYVMSRPGPRHANAAGGLEEALRGPFHRGRGGPGGWWILPEPELHLGADGSAIDPDLAGLRRERMPSLPDTAWIALRPDWACEVLSTSTHVYDRRPKMETYGRHGVPHGWLVDPDLHTLEAYENDAGVWRPIGEWRGDALVRAAPFEAVEFELGLLWG